MSVGMRPRLIKAARVVTMCDEDPYLIAAEPAFVTIGEWITAVGEYDDLLAQHPNAELVDFGNATIVPGFNDAHQHPTMTAGNMRGVDLSHATSHAQVASLLSERISSSATGEWVVGTRYDHAKSGDITPLSRDDLDELTGQHPVLLINIGAHWGVVNSAGLHAAGLTEASQDPPGGELVRDADGRLTGIVHEQALFDVAYPALSRGNPAIPPQDQEAALAQLIETLRALNALGITSVGDAMVGPVELGLLQEAHRRGLLTVRVNALLTYPHVDALRRTGLRTDFGDRWLRIGGIKAFADGAVAGGTCLVDEPFEGTEDHGIQTLPVEELDELVELVHRSGNRLAIHANGDRAIRMVLDSIESARQKHPDVQVQHRIEHCTVVDDDIVDRLRRSGTIAVPFGSYVDFHGDKLLAYYGADRLERMFAHRKLLDSGVPVAGSSDFPCGPVEPLRALRSCITRRSGSGKSDGQVLGGSQRITPVEALALYTTGSAHASGEDDCKGRIWPGFLADFAVLNGDPLTVDPIALPDLDVRQTWVGGEPVWHLGQER
ncbi:amidohydrolase [Saccharopolyspora sp. HNM0983]|uniref:Amidohydrolase n=1 Tax=Saccharopolyspora montiporae TaxID=2781240 RepID=A0A929B9I5_9PSEU|nr:amidohydrolase [Saccharopolyspora sp. HNM0983]MBE9375779.1 amidohydrolase [Saccharopolyspora sp. HNM0983]